MDIVPNRDIGKVVDQGVEKVSSLHPNSEERTNLVEQFLIAANPLRRNVIVEGKDYEAVRKVEVAIENALESVGVEMSPLKFFKRCMKEANHRHEMGENEEAPKGVAFFTDTNWGKEVIKYCAKQVKSEVARENNLEKTSAYLDSIRESKNREHTQEEKDRVSSLIANAFSPESMAKARAERKGNRR